MNKEGVNNIFISYCTNFILCCCNYNDSFPARKNSVQGIPHPEASVEKSLHVSTISYSVLCIILYGWYLYSYILYLSLNRLHQFCSNWTRFTRWYSRYSRYSCKNFSLQKEHSWNTCTNTVQFTICNRVFADATNYLVLVHYKNNLFSNFGVMQH